MTIMQFVAVVAAIVVALWPQIYAAVERAVGLLASDDNDHAPAPLSGPTYKEAISALAGVRMRLRSTNCFDDERKKAVDVLTLGLVDGSDK
jgi:hypothetical protein